MKRHTESVCGDPGAGEVVEVRRGAATNVHTRYVVYLCYSTRTLSDAFTYTGNGETRRLVIAVYRVDLGLEGAEGGSRRMRPSEEMVGDGFKLLLNNSRTL